MPTRPPIHMALPKERRLPRPTAAARGYGSAWRAYRARFLRDHPCCAECQKEDVVTPAIVVDHRKPHRGNQALFWERANHQALCKRHHDQKTAKEDGGFGNAAKRSQKVGGMR